MRQNRPFQQQDKVRINERIREKEVRVIGADGEHLGLMNTENALALAVEAGLDLVEVTTGSVPHVCRIMDYGHYKFEQAKRQKEARKKQKIIVVKEIKMRPRTDDHDFDFKVSHAKRFLEQGNKVKFTLVYRGREMAYKETGRKVLDRVETALEGFGTIETKPKMEGRALQMVVAPSIKPKKKESTPPAPEPEPKVREVVSSEQLSGEAE